MDVDKATETHGTPYKITGVTVADGPTLAATNIPAFWACPHWRLEWRHRTLEYHVSQVALRYPRNLLRNREMARHQKAVNSTTGEILAYARWSIPASHCTVNGEPVWPEAQVPAVSPEQEAEISRVADTAVWDPDYTSDPLLDGVREIEREILGRKEYMKLEYLAVHPQHQRKGIATALVRSGMRQAEKLGLDIFVHAMKIAVPLYQRLGFRIEQELVQDDSIYGGPGLWGDYFLIYEQPVTN